jgi:hypothetical protein
MAADIPFSLRLPAMAAANVAFVEGDVQRLAFVEAPTTTPFVF